MLPVTDPGGRRTSRQILIETLALVGVSLIPATLGVFGKLYLGGAIVLGIAFFVMGLQLSRNQSNAAARRLLLASVIYLPLLLSLMMIDKT